METAGAHSRRLLGWNVMNEDFFENIKETMNELKIRASYGVLGNLSGIGNYATQSVVYKGMNNMMGTELWGRCHYR